MLFGLGWEKLENQTKRHMLRLVMIGINIFHTFVVIESPKNLNPSRTMTLMVSLNTLVTFSPPQQT